MQWPTSVVPVRCFLALQKLHLFGSAFLRWTYFWWDITLGSCWYDFQQPSNVQMKPLHFMFMHWMTLSLDSVGEYFSTELQIPHWTTPWANNIIKSGLVCGTLLWLLVKLESVLDVIRMSLWLKGPGTDTPRGLWSGFTFCLMIFYKKKSVSQYYVYQLIDHFWGFLPTGETFAVAI